MCHQMYDIPYDTSFCMSFTLICLSFGIDLRTGCDAPVTRNHTRYAESHRTIQISPNNLDFIRQPETQRTAPVAITSALHT